MTSCPSPPENIILFFFFCFEGFPRRFEFVIFIKRYGLTDQICKKFLKKIGQGKRFRLFQNTFFIYLFRTVNERFCKIFKMNFKSKCGK